MDMTVASRQSDGLRAVTPDGCTVADPRWPTRSRPRDFDLWAG